MLDALRADVLVCIHHNWEDHVVGNVEVLEDCDNYVYEGVDLFVYGLDGMETEKEDVMLL